MTDSNKTKTALILHTTTPPIETPRFLRLDRHPSLVYLRSLAPGSRRTMRESLDKISLLSGGFRTSAAFDWGSVRYQHVAAVRSALVEHGYQPATVSKMLAAVRGVLKEAWRLGLLDGSDYKKAIDVHAPKIREPAARTWTYQGRAACAL